MKIKMNTKFLVTTAMCISISIVLRSFSIMITAGGVLTMRISFGAIFYVLPGLLFGPLYGAAAGGIVDILATIIMPVGGAYIPVFTLTNILAGFLPALIWKKIKDIPIDSLKKYYIIFFTVLTLIGIFNASVIIMMHNSYLGKLFMLMGKKAQYLGIGFILSGAIGFVLLIINNIVNKHNNNYSYVYNNFFKLVISVGVSGILVSTINTYFILMFTPALAAKGFMVLWLPRIVETLVITIINSYAIAVLLYSYNAFERRIPRKI